MRENAAFRILKGEGGALLQRRRNTKTSSTFKGEEEKASKNFLPFA